MNVDELLRERGRSWSAPVPAAPDLAGALRRRRRRTAGALAASGVVAAVAIATMVWTTARPPVPTTPAIPSPMATVTATPPESGVPSDDILAAATKLLARHGVTDVTSVEAVAGTAASVRAAGLGDVPTGFAGDVPLWVVQLRGTTTVRAVLDGDAAMILTSGVTVPADLSVLGTVFGFDLDQEYRAYDLADVIRDALADQVTVRGLTAADGARTTLGQAQQRLFGHTTYPVMGRGVWLVRLTGTFTCRECTSLNPDSAKAGSQLFLVIDRMSGRREALAVSAAPVDLAGLGTRLEFDAESLRG